LYQIIVQIISIFDFDTEQKSISNYSHFELVIGVGMKTSFFLVFDKKCQKENCYPDNYRDNSFLKRE